MESEEQKPRGALIVVEGLDRAGKTTQCQQLLETLRHQGHQVKYLKFPDRSTLTGQLINSYLKGQAVQDDHSIHLLFSANRWESAHDVESDLMTGTTVIIDRYSFSGAVYSAAKNNPNLSLEWAWHPETKLPRPDLLLFLSISPNEAAKRGGFGEERYETSVMQSRVIQLFERLLAMNHGHAVHVIEADSSKETVAKELLSHSLELLSTQSSLKDLRRLRSWHELQNKTR